MKCTEETEVGKYVSISFDLPEEDGGTTEMMVSLEMFMFALQNNIIKKKDFKKTAMLFYVPAFELFTEDIVDPEGAEIYAEWFESWAKDIRRKWKIRKK